MGRWLRQIFFGALVLVVAVAGIAAALAYLPFLAPQRRIAIEQIMQQVTDRPVTIAGEVLLLPGAVTTLQVGDVTIGEAEADSELKSLTVDDARLGFQLLPALRGDFQLVHLTADGIVATTSPPTDAAEEALPVSSFLLSFAKLLEARGTRDLALRELTVTRADDPDGWGADYKLDELIAKAGETTGERVITATGTINGKPAKINGTFAAVATADDGTSGRTFSIVTTLPGYEGKSSGTLSADGSALDASFTANVSSLGDMLELLKLQRSFDGTANLSMKLSGPGDAIAADSIDVEGRLSTGEQLKVTGKITDFSTASGVDVTFTADLERSDGTAPRPSSAFDIALEKIEGAATGAFNSLTLADLVISTNLTSADIQRIGPVSVDRVTRNADGHLAFLGVHILSGDPEAPSLDLKGHVLDVLGRSGIDLAGSYDLDALQLVTGTAAPAAIGHLKGELAIDDASGRLKLEKLTGSLTGNGPVQLSIDKPAPAAGATTSPVQVKLGIADLGALAKAFGAEVADGGSLSFDGSVAIDDALTVDGKAEIGQSPFTIDVNQDVTDGKSVFRGKLASSALRLDDLRSLGALSDIAGELGADEERATATAGTAPTAPPSWLDAELDVAVTIFPEQGGEPADITAHLVYGDGKAALDPLELDYAGGALKASAMVELGGATPEVTLDGSAQQLEVARLLGEAGATPLVDAPLGAQLKLDASGLDVHGLASTVTGNVAMTLGAGKIGTSLIDLTGESIISWLFTRGSGAELVCAHGAMSLEAGHGKVDRLVLETTNVQLLGTGTLDLGKDKIDLSFMPRPLHERLVGVVTPFKVHGKLTSPKISTGSAVGLARRAVVEALALPINAVGALIGVGRNSDRKPCTTNP